MNDSEYDGMMYEAMRAEWTASIATVIAKFGCQLIGVYDINPGFTYTIGLSPKYGFEIIVFGLPYSSAGFILNDICDALTAGETITCDVPDPRWANMPCVFKQANDDVRSYVCQADNYYGKRVKVLQLVLPDRDGKFPGEEGFDAEYMGPRQTLLYSP